MKIKNPTKINTKKGFTLLETLVAIFILTLSITGPVYIASVAFHNTIDSRDNISAQYLAEEVIEVLRNRRDKNSLSSSDSSAWLNNITDVGVNCSNDTDTPTNKCVMKRDKDYEDYYMFEPCNGECPPISFDPESTEAVYGSVDSVNTSKFIREVYLQTYSRDNEVKVTVNIKWTDKGRPKIYTLNERLYAINYKSFFKPDSE